MEQTDGAATPRGPSSTGRHRNRKRGHETVSDVARSNGDLLRDDRNKYKSMKVRVTSSVYMIGSFIFVLYMGHLYLWLMIVVIQFLMVRELFTLARASQEKRHQKQLPGIFFVTAMVYVYGRFLSKQFVTTIQSDKFLLKLFSGFISRFISYHMLLCYSLYTAGFVWFILSLKKGLYQYQFGQFAWTHMILFVVFTQSSFIVANIFEGIIWFLLPVSLIVINDIAAYFLDSFSATPLIKLSPKKTWEGFIGASVTTVISAFVLARLMGSSPWLTCPRKDLTVGWLDCAPGVLFKPKEFPLPGWMSLMFPKSVNILPVQWHALAFGLFASLIAPFGGFFASGFKRAFKIKDFGDSIPGHGGITDRMDCQMVMAVFSYIYYQSFIAPHHYSVEVFMEQILAYLSVEEQMSLYTSLGEALQNMAQAKGLEYETK